MANNERQEGMWLLLNGGLLVVVLWSAIGVIETSHRCRDLYASLQLLQRDQWELQENWHRLLLEEGAQATYHEIEQEAGRLLGMHIPAVSDVRRVLR